MPKFLPNWPSNPATAARTATAEPDRTTAIDFTVDPLGNVSPKVGRDDAAAMAADRPDPDWRRFA